jgi:uncharacterized membrane protein YkoI
MFKRLFIGLLALGALSLCNVTMAAPGWERMLSRQPAPVQKTIRAQLGDGRLRTIDKDDDDGDITYDVEIVRQGKTRSFIVSDDGELLSVEVFLEELPPTIQQAIKTRVGSATLSEIDKSDSDGEISYDVEIIASNKSRTFTVDGAGKLTDEEVFLAELPPDIQKAIHKETGAGTLDEITRSFDSGQVLYDVDIIENGKTNTLTFDHQGALLSKQAEIALSAVPAAAQKQIQTLSANGKLISIAKVTENDAVSFDVDIRQNGKVKSYSMDTDGKLLSSDPN